MHIKLVKAEYSELKSSGYPNFSNKKYGVSYETIVDPNESPEMCLKDLMEKAIKNVRVMHGDITDEGYKVKITAVRKVEEEKIPPF